MNEKQIKVFNLLKSFMEIANKHNLDYLLFYGSLLGAIRHNGFIPWDDDIDFIIPIETLDFLKKHYPEKIKTNENSKNPLLFVKFSDDDEDNEEAVFIDLFVVVKTNDKNIKKFLSLKRKIRALHSFTHRKTFKCQWGLRLLKFLSWWSWCAKKYTFIDAYNDLHDEKGNKYTVIYCPFKKDTLKSTFKNIDFKNFLTHKFENIDVRIPTNWNDIIVQIYGKNWKVPIKFATAEHLGLYDLKVCVHKNKKKQKH
ncbi:diacylglycerol cholinephosphotransferase Mf1 [Mycoplasmopsis primatum]|uniref:diacylglycerol cholinephosphotransferase Mf1 n=1 Tax=Mycoplasmopsis primatum TaxID=55604 RepID=UPI00069054AD|nr:LicD family protein [Mycoplasmopsis primatum]